MFARKLIKSVPFITSLVYFFNFMSLIIITNNRPSNKEIPIIVYNLYNNYVDFYIYFPLVMILIMLLIFTLRRKINLYYLTFLIFIIDFILGGFFTYLWNPNI